jgi:glycosyltransferase 2 family protein
LSRFFGEPLVWRGAPPFVHSLHLEAIVNRRVIVTLLKYGLGLGLLAYVIWRYWGSQGENPGLAEAFSTRTMHFVPLAVAGIIYLLAMLLTFFRWYILVRAQDLPFTLSAAFRLGLIGFYLSTFLPGSVGGDLIKAAFIAREQSRRTVAVATVIIDRVIGLAGLFWLVAIVGGWAWCNGTMNSGESGAGLAGLETITVTAILLTFGSFVSWFIAGFLTARAAAWLTSHLRAIPKVGGALAELWGALYMYRQRGRSVAAALGLSMVGHIGFVLAFYYAALTLSPADQIPEMGTHFLLVPVGMTVTAGFPAPGGVGGAEFIFGELYAMVGAPATNGVLGSLVQRVILWVLGLTGYLVYLRMKPTLQPPVSPATEVAVGAA